MVESLAISVQCVSQNSDSKFNSILFPGEGGDEARPIFAILYSLSTHQLQSKNAKGELVQSEVAIYVLISVTFYFLESKLSNEDQAEMESDGDESSEEYDFLERRTHEFFHELKKYDMTTWEMESVYKLISSLTDLHIIEFDDFNITLSMIFGETIRHWRPEPSLTAELFLRYLQLT